MIELILNGKEPNKDTKEYKDLMDLKKLLDFKGYNGSLTLNIDEIIPEQPKTLVEMWNRWKLDPEKIQREIPSSLYPRTLRKELPDNQLRHIIQQDYNEAVSFYIPELLDRNFKKFIETEFIFYDDSGIPIVDNSKIKKSTLESIEGFSFVNLTEESLNKIIMNNEVYFEVHQIMYYLIKKCPHSFYN